RRGSQCTTHTQSSTPDPVFCGDLSHAVTLYMRYTVVPCQFFIDKYIVTVHKLHKILTFCQDIMEVLHHLLIHRASTRGGEVGKLTHFHRTDVFKFVDTVPLGCKRFRFLSRFGIM